MQTFELLYSNRDKILQKDHHCGWKSDKHEGLVLQWQSCGRLRSVASPSLQKGTLSEIATCSDAAFLLLTLDNNYAKWTDEWLWQLETQDRDKDHFGMISTCIKTVLPVLFINGTIPTNPSFYKVQKMQKAIIGDIR